MKGADRKTKPAPKPGSSRQARNRTTLKVGLALLCVVLLCDLLGAFDLLEFKSVDLRFAARQLVQGPRPMQVPAAIVAIDDASLNGWVGNDNQTHYMPDRWSWPRDFYGTVVAKLKAAGARLIVFDITFSESSKRDPKQDQEFADAVRKAGNVIFIERIKFFDVDGNAAQKVETLIPPLDAAKLDKGFINLDNAGDGVLRSSEPMLWDSNDDMDSDKPNAELIVLRHYLGLAAEPSYDAADDTVRLGDRVIPLYHRGVDINYPGPAGTVPTFPFHDVYNGTMDMGSFKGKVVYIGSTSEILKDTWQTPFSQNGQADFPGVEARVDFLDTLLTQQYLRHPSIWFELVSVLLLGLLVIVLTYRIAALPGIGVALLVVLAWALAAGMAFISGNWVLPMVSPILAVVFPFTGLAIYRGREQERETRQTRQMFSKYVSKQIVDEILQNPDAIKLGGELKETSILFSDVRGFTTLSEQLSAPEVVEILNEYLTAMVDIVIANDGTVDKYVGDAIMSVWGSPLPDPQHRRKALRTAVQMMEALAKLRERWRAEGKSLIDIGIGIHTGQVVAGNMGHASYKMDYTVIGDAVNLAARMESANKEMRSHILLTSDSYRGCEDMVDVIVHPPIHVKGKDQPVGVIEVIGWKGQGRAPWAEPLPLK
ncbi:MAG TPA: adenylate/guanylate cyclase domain-containing protein [bacterium]|jgi:adenylate cyclase|nr:adenylate/guanylate cyclase domain-containing protein [bacterium]